jgi:hypothetical protein
MSYGIGLQPVAMQYGDADSWGGPANGQDVEAHLGAQIKSVKEKLPTDPAQFIVVLLALAALWLLGGVAFRSARM